MTNDQDTMPNGPSRRRRANALHGFTLMELMFAIGILGIGLIMAASLFPTAIKESNNSYEKTFGNMVCKNGMAVAKVTFAGSPPADGVWVDESMTGTLSRKSQHYLEVQNEDVAEGELLQGFAVAGWSLGTNDYMLAVFAYQREPGDTNTSTYPRVRLIPFTATADNVSDRDRSQLTSLSSSDAIILGGRVATSRGEIATITSTSPVQIEPQISAGSNITFCSAVLETASGVYSVDTPVLNVMTTRTGLEAN